MHAGKRNVIEVTGMAEDMNIENKRALCCSTKWCFCLFLTIFQYFHLWN